MPRYVIERELGDITDEELARAAETSKRIKEEGFPEIEWEHSHVGRTGGGLKSFCVYAAPDVQTIIDHAAAVGIPAGRVLEIHSDIVPEELP